MNILLNEWLRNSLYFAFFYYNKEGLGVSSRVIPSKGVIPLIIILLCVFRNIRKSRVRTRVLSLIIMKKKQGKKQGKNSSAVISANKCNTKWKLRKGLKF